MTELASKRVLVDDLAHLRWAMEPAAHPSTSAVAYVVSGPDPTIDGLGYELFVTNDLGGDAQAVSRGARGPRWSRDGSRLAFLRQSALRWDVAYRVASGHTVEVATPTGDAVDVDWAPDGDHLVVGTSESPASVPVDGRPYKAESMLDWLSEPRRRVWVVSLSGSVTPALDRWESHDVWGARWAPEGMQFAFISDRGVERERSTASGLWLCDFDSGDTVQLVPAVTAVRALAWAPDGHAIAYLAASRDNASAAMSELWVFDLATRTRKRFGRHLDRSVGLPVRGDDERAVGPPLLTWMPDSGSVLAIYAEGGRSRLARFNVDGSWEDVLADERCVLEFSVGRDGSNVAFSWSDPSTPGEVSSVDLSTGEERQVASFAESATVGLSLAPTRRVTVVASDGVEVEGWLTLHPDAPSGAPLVLQVHGGPHYPVGERFSFDSQRLAALGMGVLRANPRGSQGYGRAFANGNLGDWGGRDFEDLISLVDEVLRSADLDPSRTAIIGESYGGYMAAWAVASSDRFAVAVVESAIADFISSAGGVLGPTFWHSEMGGAPWENPEVYLERSAITRIDRVQAPVLVIHCEADSTCPIAQGEAIYSALRSLKRDVEFLRIPDESHFFNLFGALSRRLHRTRVLDEFLVRHLLPSMPDPI